MTFYKRTPNKVGGGSKTNLNGLSFEGRTSLIDSLNLHPNIEIKNNNEIHFSFFNPFLTPFSVNLDHVALVCHCLLGHLGRDWFINRA